MAQRRMFSPQIVCSEEFLTMPVSSRELYFQLGMQADDDGFIQPKLIMKLTGAQDDDLKVLLTKRFLLAFDGGVVVIKHWLIHNLIQKDRYHPTRFIEQKKLLLVKENKAYTEIDRPVNNLLTEVRLGKDRLSEVNLSKEIVVSDKSVFGEFKNVLLKEEEYTKLVNTYGEKNTNILIEELSAYLASKKKHYSSHYATLLSWARRKIQEHQEKLQSKKRTIV